MFGLNWGELVVIGIVALIAIGPKELPTVLRTIGQWMGKLRRMANEFQGQFQEALREVELTDLQKHAADIQSSVTDFASIDPLAEEQKQIERIGEGASQLPPSAISEPPTVSEPTPAAAAEPAVSLPMPDDLPPVSALDFAPVQAEAAEVPPPKPKKPKRTKKQAGSGA
jgi:sec-independent protein translocase protein TatB